MCRRIGDFLISYAQKPPVEEASFAPLFEVMDTIAPRNLENWSFKEEEEEEEEDSDLDPISAAAAEEMSEDMVLGRFPRRIRDTAACMRDRMLVLSSHFPRVEAGDADDWGAVAIEELAAMYQAGPVLYTEPGSDRQEQLAQVMADWFRMLSDFQYL